MSGRGRAIVIGGGIAGLSFALDALEAGLDVTLLERDGQLGGVVRSEQLGSVRVDVGAESFAVTRPDVVALAERLGMSDEVVRPTVGQAHVATRGRLMRLPAGLLGIPADADDIAALLGSDVAAEARERDAAPVPDAAPPTIGRLVRERLGDTVADTLVDPVLAGVHSTHADDAELASVAPSLHAAMRTHGGLLPAVRALRGPLGPAGSPVATIAGGMGRLIERLHGRLVALGAQVHTGAEVTALRHDGRWHVTATGMHALDDVAADVLCLAVPARVAADLLGTLEGAEFTPLIGSLTGLPTTHDVLLVSLLIEDAALTRAGAPVGSGVLVADDTVTAKAMTHASAKWGWLAEQLEPDHHVVRLSYGGTHEMTGDGDAALVASARADVLGLLAAAGVRTDDAVVRASQVTRWHGALSQPVVGRRAMLDAIDTQLALLPGLALTGSALGGNGLAGVVARSALEARRTL